MEGKGIHRLRPAAIIVLGLAAIVAVFVVAFVLRSRYADQQREQAALDSRRQDYALCKIQNDNRKATRTAALIQYDTIADVLAAGGPENPQLKQQFRQNLDKIQELLRAQRPIDCKTYVRPDLPPDQGVG